MQKIIFTAAVALFTLTAVAQNKKPVANKPKTTSKTYVIGETTPAPPPPAMASVPTMKTLMDTVSYAIGMNIAQNFKNQGFLDQVNFELFNKAFADTRQGMPALTDQAQQAALMEFSRQMQVRQTAEQAKKYESVRLEGEKFLAENKTKPGINVLPGGTQYEVIKMGDGPKPTLSDRIKAHYHGTLLNGTVFDSSVERGTPLVYNLSALVEGWQEAISQMPVGSKWKLFIPYQQGYKERGSGKIPPYAALVFEIELLGIEK